MFELAVGSLVAVAGGLVVVLVLWLVRDAGPDERMDPRERELFEMAQFEARLRENADRLDQEALARRLSDGYLRELARHDQLAAKQQELKEELRRLEDSQ